MIHFNQLPFGAMKGPRPLGPSDRHPGVTALLFYYGAFVFGQLLAVPVSLGFMDTVVTLTQLVIVGSIAWFVATGATKRRSMLARRVTTLLIMYCAICGLSFVVTRSAASELISTVINVVWLVVVGGSLSSGVSPAEFTRLFRGLLLLTVVPVACGLIELVTRAPLFTYGVMARGISESVFYIRGTHTDKLDFAAEMALCIFLCVAGLLNRARRPAGRAFLFWTAGIAAVLIAFSWSTTGILGLVVGLALQMLFYSRSQVATAFSVVALVGMFIYFCFTSLSVGAGQLEAYQQKFSLEQSYRADGEMRSFRTASMKACITGAVASPIWGIGFGNQFEYIQNALNTAKPMNAHSVLSVFLELGFVGGLPFAILLLILLRATIQAARSSTRGDPVMGDLGPVAVALTGFTLVRYLFYFHYLNSSQDFIWISVVLLANAQAGLAARRAPPRNRIHVAGGMNLVSVGELALRPGDGPERHERP